MGSSFQLDTVVALENFKKRKEANKENFNFDNSRLPAGSPMVYHCRHCGIHIVTLPESHTCLAPTKCEACKILIEHGFAHEMS